MAALFDQYPSPLLDLRDIKAPYLEPLLQEEIEEWRTDLNWDYHPSAELVRRFVDMRALTGFALIENPQRTRQATAAIKRMLA